MSSGNSGMRNSASASSTGGSPGLAISAAAAAAAPSNDGAFSSILSQRGSKATTALLTGGGGLAPPTGGDFGSMNNAIEPMDRGFEELFSIAPGMQLNDYIDLDSAVGQTTGATDLMDGAMISYAITDPTGLSGLIGSNVASAGGASVSNTGDSGLPTSRIM
ncbi:hypothetical protein GGI04_000434 [Coemansia thaxteri]|nr:hypothetical protein GGI04_000434 [Coemansia thaxteri]